MLTKICDNCEKPIQAPDDAAGKKVKCPHCGDINTFPGAPTPSAAPRKPTVGSPEVEETVLKLRPEMFRARPLSFLGLLVVLLSGLGGAGYFVWKGSPLWMAGLAAGVALLAAIVLLVWRIKNLGTCLEVTNKRTIERLGLFSRFTSEILHDDVRNVQITQTFYERIMGVGRIGISSAGQDGLEIAVKDIRNPDRIRETIDRYRPM